jgi:uncharacterized OB-fold protein
MITVREFFEGARQGRLTAIRCARCSEVAIPPKEFCPACQQRAWEPLPLSGEGEVASFTVIRVAPAKHAADAPYAVAVVRMKEGAALFGRLVDVPLDRLAVGMRVRFRPLPRDGQAAIGFAPA